MFERYTEKARRTIFFARYGASQFGGAYIETEHLLLGLVREEKSFAAELLREQGLSLESVREQVLQSEPPQALRASASIDRLRQWLVQREARGGKSAERLNLDEPTP